MSPCRVVPAHAASDLVFLRVGQCRAGFSYVSARVVIEVSYVLTRVGSCFLSHMPTQNSFRHVPTRRKIRHGTARHVGKQCPTLHVPARCDTAASLVLGPARVEVGVVPRGLGPHDEEHVLGVRHHVSEIGHLASDVVLALLQAEGRADTRGGRS